MSQHGENVKTKAMGSKRSTAIDFLRSIAIVAVVCVHSLPVPIISGGGVEDFCLCRNWFAL